MSASRAATARSALLALLLVASSSAVGAGCKKHKPPARSRIWLGASHACAQQKAGGALECWGANASGQLGDGTTAGRMLPGPLPLPLAPLGDGAAPVELALGARHTCALRNGEVRCWGDGSRGQLGTGAVTSQVTASAATPVMASGGGVLSGAVALGAARDRTCALVGDGVRCWGEGSLQAAEPEGFHGSALLVAVGEGHVCAAFGAPRVVRCSGADEQGQSAGHQPLLANVIIKSLVAGRQHTCAMLEDGSLQCWGKNDAGQLGDGTTTDSRVPALVNGLPPALEVRAGARHTCARLRNNTVACWGANDAHQLANGTLDASAKPAPVTGLVGVQELVLAGDSACARLADGGIRCWGGNAWGQLGDGTTSAHDVPMPIKAAPVAPPPAQ